MQDPDIVAALAVFDASATAKTALGTRVAAKLHEYADSEEIEFGTIENEGESFANQPGANVLVHVKYKGDAGMTSLVLAHEGVHRVINAHTMDEEIASWELQVQYFQELLKGVAFSNPGTGAASMARTKDSIPGVPLLTARAAQWAGKDQLVDYLLTKPTYQLLIGAGWVKNNIAKWGGATNRTATTRGLYVRLLSAGGDQGNGTLILDILETVTSQADWTEVLRMTGDVNKVRQVLRNARNAPIAGNRMDALSKRWSFSWQ